MVDSSPMYGSSEEVVGYCLDKLNKHAEVFAASKTWTPSDSQGLAQFKDSQTLWRQKKLDLMQVHNLLNWQEHLAMLKELKAQGLIRYIGVTTSHGRRHGELQGIIENEEIDFVQLTYNMDDRKAEQQILPLAQEKGVAVIANRPLQGGRLIEHTLGKPLPTWAADLACHNWAQFFLKFVVSHPAISCAIPATSKLAHMGQNMAAGRAELPSPKQRQRMLSYLQSV